jgi:hypothetical protein
MENEIFIVVIAAIVGPIVILFINELFRYLNSKNEKEERFFYEIYGRRITLYQKILKQIHLFLDRTHTGTFDDARDVAIITAKFIEFSDRGILVASPAVSDTLKLISNFISNEIIIGKRFPIDTNIEPFISFMTEHLNILRDRIRTETCPALVDKHLFKLTGTKITHKTS